jgi:hypothetical protein
VLPTGLNAGTILVTGPGGISGYANRRCPIARVLQRDSGVHPSTGGAYVFNGTAGSQVGAFSATVTFPNPLLVWTNQSAAGTVGRTQGFTATWTGGAPGAT